MYHADASQLGEVLRLKGSREDLLEILDLDGTIFFMKGIKGVFFSCSYRKDILGPSSCSESVDDYEYSY